MVIKLQNPITGTSGAGQTLHIDGFAIGDTFDITNLAEKGTTLSFNSSTEVLTLTHATTVITLDFNNAFTGEHLAAPSAAASDHASVGFASHAFNEQGVAHAVIGVCKA